MRPSVAVVALVLVLVVESTSRRKARHRPRLPARDESSPQFCLHTEYHVQCGIEKMCERSCDNLFSPPRCTPPDDSDPACYFPRCLCRSGFVRDKRGRCIRPKQCRVSFEELFLRDDPDGLNLKSPHRKQLRKARHFDHRKVEEEAKYFW